MYVWSTYFRPPHFSLQQENHEAKLNRSICLSVLRDKRYSIINCAASLWGWRGSWQKGRQLPRQCWAMLWGKSWVVLPNVSAILSKISEMPEMPILKSNLTASFADWSCILRSDCGTLQCLIPSTAHRIHTQSSLSELRGLPRVPFRVGLECKWKQHLIQHAVLKHAQGKAGDKEENGKPVQQINKCSPVSSCTQ